MGRKIAPRTNYRNDAIVLNRIVTAIEADERSDAAWKAAAIEHLQAAFRLLLEHRFPAEPKRLPISVRKAG